MYFIDCQADGNCTGNSDTCVSNYCNCGLSAKCSGRADSSGKTDSCKSGICKCGDDDECTGTEFCISGECRGM